VDPLGEPVPAEDPQAEEGRLEEEREQALDRERRPEDVADEPRVGAPVHAELELLHDARDDAHGEVDEEELSPELRRAQIVLLAGAIPGGVQDGDQHRQADRDRHEEEVIPGGDAELPTGEI
jgi:hypothetical protein